MTHLPRLDAYYDYLERTFGHESLFKDVDAIDFGDDFRDRIRQAVGQCEILLVVIGKTWLQVLQAKAATNQTDWVKLEIETALDRDIRVIPVLLDGVDMPTLEDLPPSLQPLAYRNAAHVRHDPDFRNDMARLQKRIEAHLSPSSHSTTAPEDDLSSEKGIDYRNLRDLLSDGKWREADKETYETMIRAVGKEPGGYFTSDELLKFPCTDLLTIDRLWVKYSNGKFGFSVQKKIYVECGAKLDGQWPGDKIWDKFCVKVGWQDAKATRYLAYNELKADPQNSPVGEFPANFPRLVGLFRGSLLSHRDL